LSLAKVINIKMFGKIRPYGLCSGVAACCHTTAESLELAAYTSSTSGEIGSQLHSFKDISFYNHASLNNGDTS